MMMIFGMGEADEAPGSSITVSEFIMDKYEITVALYRDFLEEMGYAQRPSSLDDPILGLDSRPIVGVTYIEALLYCAWRTEKEGLSSEQAYRLPTEAEWEYAARGTKRQSGDRPYTWPWGATNPILPLGEIFANFLGSNIDGYDKTAPVAEFEAGVSPWGIMNLAGNAAEWCMDWYDPEYYSDSPDEDPTGPESGTMRVIRGGSYRSEARDIRCAARDSLDPEERSDMVGFRCARKP